MQFSEVFCFFILMFTVAAAAASLKSDDKETNLQITKDKDDKKISKRQVSVLIDRDYNAQSSSNQYPQIIYRRASRHRYVKPKPKPGMPRPKYGPPKHPKSSVKKYRSKQPKPKWTSSTGKKRVPYPRYGPPKPTHGQRKPIYGPPNKHQQSSYVPQEPAGFGEPPTDYSNDYRPPKTYSEPPTDSYGAPLKLHSGTHNGYSSQDYYNDNSYQPSNYQSWQKEQGTSYNDNSYGNSQKHFAKVKVHGHDRPLFEAPEAADYDDESVDEGAYSDFYNHKMKNVHYVNHKKKVPSNVRGYSNGHKPHEYNKDHMLVGGQYAEPPARYVDKFKPSAPMFEEDDSFIGPKGFSAASSVSSYVNYKNSNMAFSPQNLNDAFSIN